MEKEEKTAKESFNLIINKILGFIDFGLAIYLIYNIFAMLAK